MPDGCVVVDTDLHRQDVARFALAAGADGLYEVGVDLAVLDGFVDVAGACNFEPLTCTRRADSRYLIAKNGFVSRGVPSELDNAVA